MRCTLNTRLKYLKLASHSLFLYIVVCLLLSRIWGRGVDDEELNPTRRSSDWRAKHGGLEDSNVSILAAAAAAASQPLLHHHHVFDGLLVLCRCSLSLSLSLSLFC